MADLLVRLRRERQVAFLFVSHDLAVVETVTDDVLVLDRGETVEYGRTSEVLTDPQQPYTKLLLAAVPRVGWQPDQVSTLRTTLEPAR